MPTVSVIIPNYNHAAFLTQRIETVLGQSYTDMELILLDDCSTDNSKAIIEQYRGHPKVSRIEYNEKNSGSTFRQWNKGVELCKGEYVWIAESDDFTDTDFLSVLMPSLSADAHMGITYCQSYKANERGAITGNLKEWTDDLDDELFTSDFIMEGKEYIERFLVHKNTVPNASGVVFRKSFYNLVGGADPEIHYCSDWLTWFKILMNSNICFHAKPLNYFRFHKQPASDEASAGFEPNWYVEQYDRIMRKALHKYLHACFPSYTGIIKKNEMYIYKEYGEEGLYYIYNKKLITGWKKILRTTIYSSNRAYFFKSAFKASVKQIAGLR